MRNGRSLSWSPAAPQGPSGWRSAERFRKIGRCRDDDRCRGCGSAHGSAGARHHGAPRSREPPPTLIGPVYGMVAALAVSEKTFARNTRVSARFRRLSDTTARRELNIQRACGFYEYLARIGDQRGGVRGHQIASRAKAVCHKKPSQGAPPCSTRSQLRREQKHDFTLTAQ